MPLFPLCLSVSLRMSIVSIVAREILDSRGNPTVEVDLRTEKGEHPSENIRERKGNNNIMFATLMSARINLPKSVKKAWQLNSVAAVTVNRF